LCTLLLALSGVASARWAAKRLDIEWRGQQLLVHWRSERPAFDEAHARVPRRARAEAAAARGAAEASTAMDEGDRGGTFQDASVLAEVEALAAHVVDEARRTQPHLVRGLPLTPRLWSHPRDAVCARPVVSLAHARHAVPG
jgi:hypothetical protein